MSVKYHLALGPYAEFEPAANRAGVLPPEDEDGCWRLPGQAAVVMRLVAKGGETR